MMQVKQNAAPESFNSQASMLALEGLTFVLLGQEFDLPSICLLRTKEMREERQGLSSV
jgi:hypothetical protein